MKSVPKLISRFVGIMMLSIILLVILNVAFYVIVFVKNTPTVSAWDIAEKVAAALQMTDTGYSLPEPVDRELMIQDVWAILIDNDTCQVVWQTDNLPDAVPMQYTLSDISELARGYIDGYPAFTGKAENGLLVLGYPKDSYWKLTRANWDYHFIAELPKNALLALAVNLIFIFFLYTVANSKLLRSIKPMINGIYELSKGTPVQIKEEGVLSELAENINRTSEILQSQAEQLRKREAARANWIAGVSHDIRTPLSMVMGYAGKLENSDDLSVAERRQAAVIVKQSRRIRDLVNDLNLASKLEYDMQPISMKPENAVAIVRQVIVDFMNVDMDTRFPIEWKTDDSLSVCCINADRDLLKRAVANLIQNSMNHNENGCIIYASVCDNDSHCAICIEDSGIGVDDEQIEKLNSAPHYMVCDSSTDEQRHGLGLLIVKQIMDGHHGKVLPEHSRYGGLKVTLVIPKERAAE